MYIEPLYKIKLQNEPANSGQIALERQERKTISASFSLYSVLFLEKMQNDKLEPRPRPNKLMPVFFYSIEIMQDECSRKR